MRGSGAENNQTLNTVSRQTKREETVDKIIEAVAAGIRIEQKSHNTVQNQKINIQKNEKQKQNFAKQNLPDNIEYQQTIQHLEQQINHLNKINKTQTRFSDSQVLNLKPAIHKFHKQYNNQGINLKPLTDTYGEILSWEELEEHDNYSSYHYGIFDGNTQIGRMTRYLKGTLDHPIIHLESIRIQNPEYRGKQIGDKLNKYCLEQYKQLGIKELTLYACYVGSYKWASEGFVFDNRKNNLVAEAADTKTRNAYYDECQNAPSILHSAAKAKSIFEEGKWILEEEIIKGNLTEKDLEETEKLLITQQQIKKELLEGKQTSHTKIKTPYEISLIGKNKPFIDQYNEKTWIGKKLLIISKQSQENILAFEAGEKQDHNGKTMFQRPISNPGWAGVKFL